MLSSLLTRKNIIIAGVVVALILVTIGVVIVIKSNSPAPPNPAIFKRCDGSSDPVEQITMSSCPNVNEIGYCEVFADKSSMLEMSFTPAEDYDATYLFFSVQAPKINMGYEPCQLGVRCPLKKGRTETLKHEFLGGVWYNTTRNPGQAKLSIFRNHDMTRSPIYCVEFPVKVVDPVRPS